MGDKGEEGVINLKKWVTSFRDAPNAKINRFFKEMYYFWKSGFWEMKYHNEWRGKSK